MTDALCLKFEVFMEDNVSINSNLTRVETELLLDAIRSQYAEQFQTHWYEERFSSIPIDQRHDALLAEIPMMSGLRHLIVALSHGLGRKFHR
jgi:hypothetical protein